MIQFKHGLDIFNSFEPFCILTTYNIQLFLIFLFVKNLRLAIPAGVLIFLSIFFLIIKNDANFMEGLNLYKGNITYKAVAEVFGHKYTSPNELII